MLQYSIYKCIIYSKLQNIYFNGKLLNSSFIPSNGKFSFKNEEEWTYIYINYDNR